MDAFAGKGMNSYQSYKEGAPRIIKRRKLHEEVADMLMRDIRSGVYPEGSFLPSESVLMKEFGVGRPAIRESLSKLSRIGLLELRPGVRPKVCKLDMTPVLQELNGVVKMMLEDSEGQKNLQQVRVLLESSLARLAARIIEPQQLAKTRQLLEEFRNVMESSAEKSQVDLDKLSDLDFQFHRSIVEVSGNPLISLLQQSLFEWLFDRRKFTLASKGQPERTYAVHLRIYRGLESHDQDLAEQSMIEHLEQVASLYNHMQHG